MKAKYDSSTPISLQGATGSIIGTKMVVALIGGAIVPVITATTFASRSGDTNTVQVEFRTMVNGSMIYSNGVGKAGGYGIHRTSGATQAALRAMGVTLDRNISGAGDAAEDGALMVAAKVMLRHFGVRHRYITLL